MTIIAFNLSICLNHWLNCQNIKKDPQRISKIKSFINQYNWKEVDFPSEQKDRKKSDKCKSIAVNVLFLSYNTEKVRLSYKSKYNFKHENQVILLMISDGKNGAMLLWNVYLHYLEE